MFLSRQHIAGCSGRHNFAINLPVFGVIVTDPSCCACKNECFSIEHANIPARNQGVERKALNALPHSNPHPHSLVHSQSGHTHTLVQEPNDKTTVA